MTLTVAYEDLVVPGAHHFGNSGVLREVVLLVLPMLQAARHLRTW
jgi:hypothetical protein